MYSSMDLRSGSFCLICPIPIIIYKQYDNMKSGRYDNYFMNQNSWPVNFFQGTRKLRN